MPCIRYLCIIPGRAARAEVHGTRSRHPLHRVLSKVRNEREASIDLRYVVIKERVCLIATCCYQHVITVSFVCMYIGT
jgi:hypothetical protein